MSPESGITSGSSYEARYQLGNEVLAPALVCFAWLLMLAAKRDGLTRLAFVARDGALLLEVFKRVSRQLHWTPPALDYIYLSRISTALPAQTDFGLPALHFAHQVRAGTSTVESLFAFFGMEVADIAAAMNDHGLTADTPVTDLARLGDLIDDPRVKDWVAAQRCLQSSLLRSYLKQHEVIGNPHCALVDIGWHGSIPIWLARAFPDVVQDVPIRACYLGHWSQSDQATPPTINITGLLCDGNRSRSVLEAAPRYLTCVLESICRANHGTVTGYLMGDDGRVSPVLADNAIDANPENSAQGWREPIRQGILDGIPAACRRFALREENANRIRREVNGRLFRLAFFPRKDELMAAAGLVHTEGHRAQWSRPLIDATLPHPILSPRRWLAGMASPWRSGYVAASGGVIFAALFVLVESVLLLIPNRRRQGIERFARRLGGLS